ncbi:nucleoside hydrolase [Oceanobacillus indicireducens]|uniref:Nucleoside hydrolase n=2 Tax=Oceanobacillus indicireducens TaxID=1004261 RepID=A0A917XUU5_9BACI|nr:nucleoside hydrolase [Oceanobacillus indicireducens]
MYMMMDPEIEIVGIVTSYGNVPKEQATANAAYLMQLAGRTDIPIIPGVSQPMEDDYLAFYPEIHGKGIGPIQPPHPLQYQTYPFDTIRFIIEKYKNELILVDTGRSTALATIFILFPEHAKLVHSYYVMGGAFFMPGNATALAEANFYGDPNSSDFVVKSAHNLTITPLNATQFAVITEEMVQAVSKNEKQYYAALIVPVFEYYYDFYQKLMPGIQGAPVHDLLTVMIINHPSLCDYIYYDVHVARCDEVKGMSYIDYRPTSKRGKTRIAVSLDYAAFVEQFNKVMLPE